VSSTITVMSLDDRLVRLERKVDYLFQRMGVDPSAAFAFDDDLGLGAGLPESFHEALARGKTIEAIKIYRDVTGAGLKEAKSAVESMTGR
jgi:ribosomal protein L7/L12